MSSDISCWIVFKQHTYYVLQRDSVSVWMIRIKVLLAFCLLIEYFILLILCKVLKKKKKNLYP